MAGLSYKTKSMYKIVKAIRESNDNAIKSLGKENLELHELVEWKKELEAEGKYIQDAEALIISLDELAYELTESDAAGATAVTLAVKILKEITK